MRGLHFPLSLAMVCTNCLEVFQVQPVCPACTSRHIEAIETWLTRRREETQRAAFIAKAERELQDVWRFHKEETNDDDPDPE